MWKILHWKDQSTTRGTIARTQNFNRQVPEIGNKNDNFDSALAQHIYENPAHLVIFEEATLISTVNGLPQSFKEAIEIKKHINRNLAINRDMGDISLSPIYNNLILKESMNISAQSNLRQHVRISNENRNCRQAKSVARQRILIQSNW